MTHLLARSDARRIPLPDNSVQCVITSPPYFGLRSYLPDLVRLKSNMDPATRCKILAILEQLDIKPIDHTSG